MAIVGYARVSTENQNLDRQLDALESNGCDKIFQEKVTGKNKERPQLNAMLDYIREGDSVIVTSISRLARSNRDLHNLVHQMIDKGCQVQFLKEGIDTSTANGKLVLGIFASIAEFERELIVERVKDGIDSAKARGVHCGRPRKELPSNWDRIVEKWKNQKLSAVDAYRKLGVSKSFFYRNI